MAPQGIAGFLGATGSPDCETGGPSSNHHSCPTRDELEDLTRRTVASDPLHDVSVPLRRKEARSVISQSRLRRPHG